MALKRNYPDLDEAKLLLTSKLRYSKPESEPGSPTTSRSSTPAHFTDDDESSTDDDDEADLRSVASTSDLNGSRTPLLLSRCNSEKDVLSKINA
jgi:hypothetical protein